jgi:hypothetical protein
MRVRFCLLYSVLAFAILMGPKTWWESGSVLIAINSLSPALIFVLTRPHSVLTSPRPTQFCTLRVSTFTE